VRNRDDGTVEITAEGDRSDLEKLVAAAREGPRGARVSRVDTAWEAARGDLEPFDLTY
jgi:acylphosphatase